MLLSGQYFTELSIKFVITCSRSPGFPFIKISFLLELKFILICFSVAALSRFEQAFFAICTRSVFTVSRTPSSVSRRLNVSKSSIIFMRRSHCVFIIPRKCFAVSGSLIPSSSKVSVNPFIEVTGVFNSWLTFATKSFRICSTFFKL